LKQFILDAFLIPLEAYFTPRTFRNRLTKYVPDHYTFLQALTASPENRRKALRFLAQLCASMLIIPVLAALITWLLLPNANLPYMMVGALASVVLGIGFGILPDAFSHFKYGMAGGIAFGVFFGSILSVLMGVYSSVAGSTSPDAINAVVNGPTGLAVNAVLLGSFLGMAIRVYVATVAKDVRQTMLVGLIILIPLTISLALFSSPRVLMTNRLAGICSLLAFTGWFVLPVQLLISVVNIFLVKTNPDLAPRLWKIAPVNWDDFLIFPMPDTIPLLENLYEVDRNLYQNALERIRLHPFQSRYARIAEQKVAGQKHGESLM
jgi:hypothetical protein